MAGQRNDAVVTVLVVAVLVVLAASAVLLLLPLGKRDGSPRAAGPPSSTADDGRAPAAEKSSGDGAMPVTDVSGREASFRTPSGNIGCLATPSAGEAPDAVRCEIGDRAWEPPPQPSDCDLAWGDGLVLTGISSVLCTGDTIGVLGAPDGSVDVLDYGTALKQGSVSCASSEKGLRCADAGTGSGFVLSRGGYELF